MVMTSYPKVGGSTTDTQYAELFSAIIGSGIRGSGDLIVSADSSGMKVKLASGFGIAAGCAFKSTATEDLAIEANTSGNGRVDTVVLRRDYGASSTVTPVVKLGSPAPNPVPPILVQDETGVWEEPLADVRVANNAATITSANVTDRRRMLSTNVGSWSTSGRPPARLALFGFNSTTGRWEGHDGASWVELLDASAIVVQPSAPSNPKPNQIHLW